MNGYIFFVFLVMILSGVVGALCYWRIRRYLAMCHPALWERFEGSYWDAHDVRSMFGYKSTFDGVGFWRWAKTASGRAIFLADFRISRVFRLWVLCYRVNVLCVLIFFSIFFFQVFDKGMIAGVSFR